MMVIKENMNSFPKLSPKSTTHNMRYWCCELVSTELEENNTFPINCGIWYIILAKWQLSRVYHIYDGDKGKYEFISQAFTQKYHT